MPVDPSRFRWRRRGRIVVSGAGPAMNVLLALLSLAALAVWLRYADPDSDFHRNLATFLFVGGKLNIVLAVFNLLPVPPLDGADILRGLSFRAYRFYDSEQVRMIGMFIILAIFMSGIGSLIWVTAVRAALSFAVAVAGLLGIPDAELRLAALIVD
jgi:Zn-dependent protease